MAHKTAPMPAHIGVTVRPSADVGWLGHGGVGVPSGSWAGHAAWTYTWAGSLNVLVGCWSYLGGLAETPAIAVGTVPAVLLTGFLGWKRQKTRNNDMIVVPQSAAEQIQQVRLHMQALRATELSSKKKEASPEVGALTREGLRLVGQYDLVLEEWGKSAWANSRSPETLQLEQAAAALATTIGAHADAVEERLAWEEARRTELSAPVVQDAGTLASVVLADVEASAARLASERTQVSLERQALSSLRGDVDAPESAPPLASSSRKAEVSLDPLGAT